MPSFVKLDAVNIIDELFEDIDVLTELPYYEQLYFWLKNTKKGDSLIVVGKKRDDLVKIIDGTIRHFTERVVVPEEFRYEKMPYDDNSTFVRYQRTEPVIFSKTKRINEKL